VIGLGLSIVAAIAQAHGASLAIRPRPDGGLQAEVGFPRPAPGSGEATDSDCDGIAVMQNVRAAER
jgi:K+-sensing histidine kinase KdpD